MWSLSKTWGHVIKYSGKTNLRERVFISAFNSRLQSIRAGQVIGKLKQLVTHHSYSHKKVVNVNMMALSSLSLLLYPSGSLLRGWYYPQQVDFPVKLKWWLPRDKPEVYLSGDSSSHQINISLAGRTSVYSSAVHRASSLAKSSIFVLLLFSSLFFSWKLQ